MTISGSKLAVQENHPLSQGAQLQRRGWFDQEDFAGPWRIFAASETPDSTSRTTSSVGPWNHGGWFSGAGRTLEELDFGSDTADYFRENIQAHWFAYWLKGKECR